MPEDDVIGKLARFTPATPAVDRDELLFRAGRAAAPSARPWKAATAGLAATQLVTLAVWLGSPRPAPAPPPPGGDAPAPVPAVDSPAGRPPDPGSYLALVRELGGEVVPPPPPAANKPAPTPMAMLRAGRRDYVLD